MNKNTTLSTLSKTIDKAKKFTTSTTSAVVDATLVAVDKTREVTLATTDKVTAAIKEKKLAQELELVEKRNIALEKIKGTFASEFVDALRQSPLELSNKQMNQIKKAFPIPREQHILWADAEFDLRPSGIAVTDCGVFIKSDVGVFDDKIKKSATEDDNGKSILFYYRWDEFEPAWFIGTENSSNKALTVDRKCANTFIAVCTTLAERQLHNKRISDELDWTTFSAKDNLLSNVGFLGGAAVESAQAAVFVEQKAHINTPAGHGEMAEEAINMLDRLHGLDARVIGRDNVKNGPDRQIGDIFIQTKYYNSARGSLEACFDPITGNYRYTIGNTPMQLEVPKDQYQRVLEGFKQKIADGKVVGVTDPNEAANFIREGRLTYKQAVNLTKPGTIESLCYDVLTGAVICSCAFGITFVATVYITWRKTGNLEQAIQAGTAAGLQVFGLSFIQHIVVSQVARTGLANALLAPSQYLVAKLGYQTSATLVNGIRALSGKGAIYGAAASKHLAKILRSNVLISAITFTVFSVPETYNVATRRISTAQYVKNIGMLAGTIAASAGGAMAAGVATAKIAGVAGTAVAPGVGTAIGIAGGFVGGAAGTAITSTIGDIIHENDIQTLSRLFNAIVSCMVSEYLLNETEIGQLIEDLNKISQKEFKALFSSLQKSNMQECIIQEFLEPHFDAVLKQRAPFMLPEDTDVFEAVLLLSAESDDVFDVHDTDTLV